MSTHSERPGSRAELSASDGTQDAGPGTRCGLLEVIALGPADATAAQAGGADRLEIVADMVNDGLSPDPATVASIRRATDLPIRVMLRAEAGFVTSTGELQRLARLADHLVAAGADGFVFGFLSPSAEIDVDATSYLADCDAVTGRPWTFHRAVDNAFQYGHAWRDLDGLPGLDSVLTAGSARGLTHGFDDLLAALQRDPSIAGLVMAGGGLQAEHVPWLARAGVSKFHIGSGARPQGSWKAYVDAGFVRSWRTLIDSAVSRA